MKTTIAILAALISTAATWAAELAANGLLLYREPSSGYVGAVRYNSFEPGAVDSVLVLVNGERQRYYNNGIIAKLDYPPVGLSSRSESALLMLRQAQQMSAQFPNYKRQIDEVVVKWQNAIASAKPESKATESPALITRSGTTYRDAKISGLESDGLHITHADGVATVAFDDLPDLLQKQFLKQYESITRKLAEEKTKREKIALEENQRQQTALTLTPMDRGEEKGREDRLPTPGQNPTSSVIDQLISEGNELLRSGRAAEALKKYDQAVGRNPFDYKVRVQRGFCNLQLAKTTGAYDQIVGEGNRYLDGALKDFNTAIQSYNEDVDAHAGRAEALFLMGETERAFSDMQTALAIDKKHAFTFKLLGDYYTRKSDEDRALKAYSYAASLEPKFQSYVTSLREKLNDPQRPMKMAAEVEKKRLAEARKAAHENLYRREEAAVAQIESQIADVQHQLQTANSLNSTGGVFGPKDKQKFSNDVRELSDELRTLRAKRDEIRRQYQEANRNIDQQ